MPKLSTSHARIAEILGQSKSSRLWKVRHSLASRWPRLHEFRRQVYFFFRRKSTGVPPGVTPFAIVTSPRTGSNLLQERLTTQWKTVRSDAEIFSIFTRGSLTSEGIVQRTYFADTGHTFVGSKVMLPQVSDEDLKCVLAVENIHLIVLARRNTVRQYVSLKIAQRDKIFSQPTESSRLEVDKRKIHVDVSDLLEYRDIRTTWYSRLESSLAEQPRLDVFYEDMEADLDREMERVASFLGIGEPDRVEPPRLLRQNPEPLRDLISNFDQLRTELIARGEQQLVEDLES